MMIVSKQQMFLSLVATVVVMVLAVPSGATSTDMNTMPVISPFECTNCHLSDAPSGEAVTLNDFGNDFLIWGWGPELAALDSDGDGCNNGVEIGDSDGDGTPDNGVTDQSSNPGVGDCSSASTDVMTWSELKGLFNGQ